MCMGKSDIFLKLNLLQFCLFFYTCLCILLGERINRHMPRCMGSCVKVRDNLLVLSFHRGGFKLISLATGSLCSPG